MASKELIEKIKKDIEEDKRTYLQNCNKENYHEYCEAGRTLFKKGWDILERRENSWYVNFTEKALEAKQNKETETEKQILEMALNDNIGFPYAYERLAVLYSKEKDFLKAYNVCKKWFSSIYWGIPNMVTKTLKILDRMEKLEKKLDKK